MEKSVGNMQEIRNREQVEMFLNGKDSIEKFRRTLMQYECAMLEIKTKLDVLNTELSLQKSRNPFETIKCRIKSPESIFGKMEKNNIPMTVEAMEKYLNDIAGIRVICSFPDDIYMLADCLLAQDDITLVARKDYIKKPKPNGYRSLHLIVEVPIFLTDEKKPMRVEVQFRTIAMDFWASLEHKMKYKKDINDADKIVAQLKDCADSIEKLDYQMQDLRNKIDMDGVSAQPRILHLLQSP